MSHGVCHTECNEMLRQMTRRTALGTLAGMPALPLISPAASDPLNAAGHEVPDILRQRIDVDRQSVGMVVGLCGRAEARFIAHGARALTDPRPPDRNTVFNIGSITKVFTAVLLADAVLRGEMSYDDPVQRHLPAELAVPEADGTPITLADLATHTSGLPVLPDNYPAESDPQARSRYTRGELHAFLSSYRPASRPGEKWSYSNLGYALLAAALAHRTGMPYEAMLHARVTQPMKLRSTAATLSADLLSRLAPGHDLALKMTHPGSEPLMAGAGGLYSTAADLTVLVEAFLGYRETPLAPALAEMLQIRRPMNVAGGQQAIGPSIFGAGARVQIGHAGSDPGYASSIAWTPGRFGVVVLSNGAPPVLDITAHLLEPSLPLAAPMHAFAADPASFNRYVGRYRAQDGMIFVVTQEPSGLTFEAVGGAPKIDITPESQDVFTVPRIRARITFEGAAPAPASAIRVEYGGLVYTGARVEP